MRDRRTYDARRRTPARAGRDASQRNALIAIIFFVAAFAFVGVMLLSGRGDDEPATAGSSATPAAFRQIGASPTAEVTTAATQPVTAGAPTATTPSTAPTGTATAAEPTAAATDEPTTQPVEPTEEAATAPPDAAEPEPTAVPLIGDFGALPPAQIVSGGLSRGLSLEYVLDPSTVSAPETATVYKFVWPEYTTDDIAVMATNLGINGEVEAVGSGTFRVSGSDQSLFVRPHAIQYSNAAAVVEPLADDGTLIAAAESWLASSGLVSSDVGGGRITGRNDESDIAVVLVQPASPSPLLAAFPSASITVTGEGVVREANVQWPADYIASEYGMRSLGEVWNQVLAGQGAIEADMSEVPGDGAVSATFTVESVGLAYSVGAGSAGEFLLPIMVFSGTAVSDDGTTFPAWVYMSAVQGETSAAG